MSQSGQDSPRSAAAVVSNLRSKYLSILSEEAAAAATAEETGVDGRSKVRPASFESYAQKSLPPPPPSAWPVLIKVIRPGRDAGTPHELIRYYLFLIIFDSISPEIPATRISSRRPCRPPDLPASHLPALGRNRIIKPLIGALLPNPRSEFLLALSGARR